MRDEVRDSIAAIATAPGAGALAIVRVSGPEAVAIGDRVFRGSAPLAAAGGYTVHHGSVVGSGDERFDEVLVTLFRAPRSYTGEDMIEISCHGGGYVTREVLRVVMAAGARPAQPGEFTRRAFLNGRIDLSQAEAVADVIAARSRRGHRVSLEQLAGRLGDAVRTLRTEMLDLCALLELELDFSEEGLDVITANDVQRRVVAVRTRIDALLASYAHGRIYRDGVGVVLAGEPNAGKSSVFNALLRQDRAIVTPVPGTTRDALEEVRRNRELLRDLLDLSRLESPEVPVASERVALEDVRRVLAQQFEHVCAQRRLTLVFEIEPELGEVVTDRKLLVLILRNLIENASKFAHEQTPIRVVGRLVEEEEVSPGQSRGIARFEVIDRGVGIPLQHQERVFERFFRGDPARGRVEPTETSGAGLGLAISRRIAEAHGGTLQLVASRPGRTEFCLTLPATVPAPRSAPPSAPHPARLPA